MTTEMNHPADELSRRTFLRLSAIAGAGLMLNPLFSFGKDASIEEGPFINGMIPACLLLQTAALAQQGTFVSQDVKNALQFSIWLTNDSNFAFAGLLPHRWSVVAESTFSAMPKEKPSFEAGTVVSNVANECFSKIYSSCDQKEMHDLRLYHDSFLLRNISNIDVKQTTKDELAIFFQTLVSPMITRTHTLRPNRDDGMDWIVQMTRWNRAYHAYCQELAQTIIEPDPKKENAYINKANFMNVSDRSVRYAIEGKAFGELKQIDENKSVYGKALYESLKRICDSFKS